MKRRLVVLLPLIVFTIMGIVGTPMTKSLPTSSVNAAVAKQGAYAYSLSTGRYGFAYNYSSRDAAEERALGECNADDCEVVLLFTGCGALAKGHGGAVGWAYAGSVDRAESIAMGECSKRGGGCEVVSSQCND